MPSKPHAIVMTGTYFLIIEKRRTKIQEPSVSCSIFAAKRPRTARHVKALCNPRHHLEKPEKLGELRAKPNAYA
jgi:hypothetical protein